MTEDISLIQQRQDRIEDAIARLTEISANLNKMVAVHNEKLTYQERQINLLEESMERRREEADLKLRDVYNTIRSEDNNIVASINALREENARQHNELRTKVNSIEKTIWMYMGAFTVIAFLLAYGPNIIRVVINSH